MLRRIVTASVLAVVALVATATTAVADYPPSPVVKGETVHNHIATVVPERALAFTGSDVLPWLGGLVMLLIVGAALLYRSRRPQES
jgi:hypothetical protein